MPTRKSRTDEEVAAEFAGGASVMDSSTAPDDEPEPDHAKLAGITREGTVDSPPGTPTDVPIDMNNLTMEKVLFMMVEAMQKIAAGQTNAQLAAQQALDQAARQQQPDNKFAPQISMFNPQGDLHYPRPVLKCEMFIPWEAEAESLTYEEIELLNLLEEGEYTIKRNDGLKVEIKIRASRNLNGKMDRLLMNSEVGFNNDNAWLMPSLTGLLRQVLNTRPHTKEAAAKVLTMDDRYAMVADKQLPVSVGVR